MHFPMKYLMKPILNLIFFLIIIKMNSQGIKNNYPENVGDIQFDSNIDDPNFKICDPARCFQYYNFLKGFQYKGEKYQILELWKHTNLN